jgi:hypothetical protein
MEFQFMQWIWTSEADFNGHTSISCNNMIKLLIPLALYYGDTRRMIYWICEHIAPHYLLVYFQFQSNLGCFPGGIRIRKST